LNAKKVSKKECDSVPNAKQKKVNKVDEKKILLLQHCEALISYLANLRQFTYVCRTEKINTFGIRVSCIFYTDWQGGTVSDFE